MKLNKARQSNFSEQPARRRICTLPIVPLLLLWMLPAGLGLMMAGRVSAQVFTTLYSFTGSDGAWPNALVLSGSTLYGTTYYGGTNNTGTVFAVNTDGTGFTNLHGFTALSGDSPATNIDGAIPVASLILSGSTLYGTATFGGSSGNGTVFAVNTDGTGFTVLHSFTATSFYTDYTYTNSDGAGPYGGVMLSGNTLYGTATQGGTNGCGTVFAVNTDGTGFTNLHSFAAYPSNEVYPDAGLILSGDTLYGTTCIGGGSGYGTVFALNTDGTGFTVLHSFTAITGVDPAPNSDGAFPVGSLILSGNTLYGTASEGGTNNTGTVFAINTDGTGFTVLHSFTRGSDGAYPDASLILSGNTLYGTANSGTVFAVNTDGTGFTVLYSFTGWSAAAISSGGLILSGNTLYGTGRSGGTNGFGTVFSIFIQPQLTLTPSGPYMILTWPTNYSGFTLQSTTNFGSAAVWTTNSSPPVVIGGQNVVINTMSGTQQFYRLSQ